MIDGTLNDEGVVVGGLVVDSKDRADGERSNGPMEGDRLSTAFEGAGVDMRTAVGAADIEGPGVGIGDDGAVDGGMEDNHVGVVDGTLDRGADDGALVAVSVGEIDDGRFNGRRAMYGGSEGRAEFGDIDNGTLDGNVEGLESIVFIAT